jgi:hypothetical protein
VAEEGPERGRPQDDGEEQETELQAGEPEEEDARASRVAGRLRLVCIG